MKKQAETTDSYSFQPPNISVFSAPAGRNYSSKSSKDHYKKPNLQPVSQIQQNKKA